MNEKIAAVIIPGNNLSNNKCRNGEIDILLFSEDNAYLNIKNDDDFMIANSKIDEYKELDYSKYHIDVIREYLKKEFRGETSTLNLERFDPNSSFVLYQILASVGNIIILNSEHVIPIFMPIVRKISKEQLEALNRISGIIDNDIIQAAFVDINFKIQDEHEGNIEEIIEYINSQRKVNNQ